MTDEHIGGGGTGGARRKVRTALSLCIALAITSSFACGASDSSFDREVWAGWSDDYDGRRVAMVDDITRRFAERDAEEIEQQLGAPDRRESGQDGHCLNLQAVRSGSTESDTMTGSDSTSARFML
ncbi:MAG: hypothetical protein IT303_00595 [Dehalococcoidia bacterium]|nr:hypothetical protein [Dehalococcoidia bacterium]